MYRWKISVWACVLGSALVLTRLATGQRIGDGPAIPYHLSQTDIEDGRLSFAEVVQHGDLLFNAVFNKYDGQGRPATTGSGAARIYGSAPAMLRTSGPDASSCAGCHNQPRAGGAGDFVANVFVLAQALDPVTESVSGQFSNERNTLGIILADVDHFKKINDHYGHGGGDAVLVPVVQRISATLRPYDVIGRYGGEEFLIIAPGCDLVLARRLAERVRAAVHDEAIDLGNEGATVTVSLGVTLGTHESDPEFLVALADTAMYQAKRNGRDRVEVSTELSAQDWLEVPSSAP